MLQVWDSPNFHSANCYMHPHCTDENDHKHQHKRRSPNLNLGRSKFQKLWVVQPPPQVHRSYRPGRCEHTGNCQFPVRRHRYKTVAGRRPKQRNHQIQKSSRLQSATPVIFVMIRFEILPIADVVRSHDV